MSKIELEMSVFKKDLVNAEVVKLDINNIEDIILDYTYSPAIFKNNQRKNKNFIKSNLIVLDVDDGPTLSEAINIFKNHRAIIATTKNHQKKKNNLVCDRYRIILVLDSAIQDAVQYQLLLNNCHQKYPFVDLQCCDLARLFFSSNSIIYFNKKGKLLNPMKFNSTGKESSVIHPPSTILNYTKLNPEEVRAQSIERISKKLKEKSLKFRDISKDQVSSLLFENYSNLKNRKAILNQEFIATTFNVSVRSVSNLIKRLKDKGFIQIHRKESRNPANPRNKTNIYKLGPTLKSLGYIRQPWKEGCSNQQMMADIRYCFSQGFSKDQTLNFCKENQGIRPSNKFRSDDKILTSIDNWWKKNMEVTK